MLVVWKLELLIVLKDSIKLVWDTNLIPPCDKKIQITGGQLRVNLEAREPIKVRHRVVQTPPFYLNNNLLHLEQYERFWLVDREIAIEDQILQVIVWAKVQDPDICEEGFGPVDFSGDERISRKDKILHDSSIKASRDKAHSNWHEREHFEWT